MIRQFIRDRFIHLSRHDIINGCKTNFTCPDCGELLFLNDSEEKRFYCPECGKSIKTESAVKQRFFMITYEGVAGHVFCAGADKFKKAVLDLQQKTGCDCINPVWYGEGGIAPYCGHAPWKVAITFTRNFGAFVPSVQYIQGIFSCLVDPNLPNAS